MGVTGEAAIFFATGELDRACAFWGPRDAGEAWWFRAYLYQPADKFTLADVSSYTMETYTYAYQKGYGSPEVDGTIPLITQAIPGENGKSVYLQVKGMVKGHVHEIKMDGVRRHDSQQPLLHQVAYYTLNEIPTP